MAELEILWIHWQMLDHLVPKAYCSNFFIVYNCMITIIVWSVRMKMLNRKWCSWQKDLEDPKKPFTSGCIHTEELQRSSELLIPYRIRPALGIPCSSVPLASLYLDQVFTHFNSAPLFPNHFPYRCRGKSLPEDWVLPLLFVAHYYPQNSLNHLRHSQPWNICTRGCSIYCCNHTKNHKGQWLESSRNHCNSLTYHYNNYKGNQSPSAKQTSPDTRTSRLHPGLHSTRDKKITLPFCCCCCWGYFFYQHAPIYTDSSSQSSAPQAPVCGYALDLLLVRMKGQRNQRTRQVVRLLPCHQHFLGMK